jgi:hypothetical protein
MVVVALGITWVLEGLEVTIVGALSRVLQSEDTLHLSSEQIGTVASCYVAGAVLGAIVFGWLTDRFGRRTVFYVTLVIYLGGVLLTAVSWGMASFAIFRFITGLGIGGEYAAINSAIDELNTSAAQRPDRPYHQWELLDRGGDRRGRDNPAPQPRPAAGGFGLAARIRDRRSTGPGHLDPSPPRAGEPALARHSRV